MTVLENPYIKHVPFARQAAFLVLPHEEILYGGAAGGGKSDALLMAALQFVHVPGYAAILFRRTYADLALPGALMDRAHDWLDGTDAHWNETQKTWTFPTGASLSFGYLDHEDTRYRYQSAEFQFVGFDELTQFSETQYTYLFSRLRRLEGCDVPIRMRAGTNPGGPGHDWVNRRFGCDGKTPRPATRFFVPAVAAENIYLDREAYATALANLDPITRAQLANGDWSTLASPGALWKYEWIGDSRLPMEKREEILKTAKRIVVGIDPAVTSTEHSDENGIVVCARGADNRGYVIADRSMRGSPLAWASRAIGAYEEFGADRIIAETNQGGEMVLHTLRTVRRDVVVDGIVARRGKALRADPIASMYEQGLISHVGSFPELEGQMLSWVPGEGDSPDRVDALVHALTYLFPQNTESKVWIL